jgi:hypothetical protein
MSLRFGFGMPVWIAGLLTVATSAAAHEYWLAPSTYRAVAGDTVRVGAWVGTGFAGEARPWTRARAARFVARGGWTSDLRSKGVEGDLEFGRMHLPDEGGFVFAYESNFAEIELPADEFDRYLEAEGLDEARAARAKSGGNLPGRERYARSAKTWIAGSDPNRVRGPFGHALELFPQTDPSRHGALRVAVLYRGAPVRGVLVRAWRQDLGTNAAPRDAAARDSVGPAAEARTNSDGVARLEIEGDGEWLLSAVHMIPCADRTVADWESRWASLTFARGPAVSPKRR